MATIFPETDSCLKFREREQPFTVQNKSKRREVHRLSTFSDTLEKVKEMMKKHSLIDSLLRRKYGRGFRAR